MAAHRELGDEEAARQLLGRSNIAALLVDDGLRLGGRELSLEWHRGIVPDVGRVLRVETLAEDLLVQARRERGGEGGGNQEGTKPGWLALLGGGSRDGSILGPATCRLIAATQWTCCSAPLLVLCPAPRALPRSSCSGRTAGCFSCTMRTCEEGKGTACGAAQLPSTAACRGACGSSLL